MIYINIYDIAEKAGVSIATVSLALNNKKGISEKTKKKILDIANEYGYSPNSFAKGLSTKSTNNIAIFISVVDYNSLMNTFYFEIVKSFSKSLYNTPYQMLLYISTINEEIPKLKELISKQSVDAIIFLSLRMPINNALNIAGKIPCVFINRPNNQNAYSVNADNEKAMYLLTKYMLDLGHKDIAFLGYIPHLISTEARYSGYLKAHKEYRIVPKPQFIIFSEYTQDAGYIVMRRLIQSNTVLPSGIIGGNDLIAIGAMEAIWDAGYSIPKDISVAGIHNIPNTHLLKVPLTTIKIPHNHIGEIAAKKVLKILNNESVDRETTIDVDLIVRDSVSYFTHDITNEKLPIPSKDNSSYDKKHE